MMLLALIIAAGAATASDISLTGGMSMIDGTFIKALFAGMAAVIGAIGGIFWHSRKVKSEIPQPCKVERVNDCVSVQECNRRMKELDERMTKLEARVAVGFDNILKKLDAMDQRSEDRAIALNRRIDPMMERLAETSGQVKMMKEQIRDARAVATIGGEK